MNPPKKPNKQLFNLVPLTEFVITYHDNFIWLESMEKWVDEHLRSVILPSYLINYDLIKPFKVSCISVEKEYYGYDNDCSISLVFTVEGLLEPKDLKKRQAKFDKDMEKYEQYLKEYKVFQQTEKELEEKKLFLKLKKKFENGKG